MKLQGTRSYYVLCIVIFVFGLYIALTFVGKRKGSSDENNVRNEPMLHNKRGNNKIGEKGIEIKIEPKVVGAVEQAVVSGIVRIPESRLMIRRSDWKKVGLTTPDMAVQTIYAAIRDYDVDLISKAIKISEPPRKRIETEIFELLPEKVQKEYNTAERIAALYLIEEENVKGFLVSNERIPVDGKRRLSIATPGIQGKMNVRMQEFVQSSNGEWLRLISPSQVNQWMEREKFEAIKRYNSR